MSGSYNSLGNTESSPPLLPKNDAVSAQAQLLNHPTIAGQHQPQQPNQLLQELVLQLRNADQEYRLTVGGQPAPRPHGFYNSARANHSHYFLIMGLLLVPSMFLIVSLNRFYIDQWWYILLGISICLDLVGICGVTVASCCNYDGSGRVIDDGATLDQIPDRECHFCFHFIVLASVICLFTGTCGALFIQDRVL